MATLSESETKGAIEMVEGLLKVARRDETKKAASLILDNLRRFYVRDADGLASTPDMRIMNAVRDLKNIVDKENK